MALAPGNPHKLDRTGRRDALNGALAFVVTILAAYASALPGILRGSAASAAAVVAVGLVYTAIGIFADDWCRRVPGLWPRLLYFAVQLPLAGAIFYLSQAYGFMALIVFPLISQAQGLRPRWLEALMGVLCVATFCAALYLVAGLGPVLNSLPVMVAGLVFVAVFTQVALRERDARGEVERLAAELGAANQKLRESAAQVEELATTQERNRLAREIHDSLGHYLTVINVQLEAAQAVAQSDPARAREAVRKAQSLAQEGLADVRRSVAALRAAPGSSRPLPEAVGELVQEARAAGLLTSLKVLGAARPMAAQAEQALFRAAQEALTNVRKHARASRADLSLDYSQAGRVRLVVQDNGVGAALNEAARPEAGFGLLGLRERVQLAGGSVSLRSTPGEGFRLEVEAPG